MRPVLQIIPTDLLKEYVSGFDRAVKEKFEELHDNELSIDAFSFYTSISAVYSSKIEGEDIELDSFIKHKRFGVEYQPDYTRKTDDLYDAYSFARQNKLNPETLNEAHALLTQHILQKNKQGRLRTGNMFVLTDDGKIEYVAAPPHNLESELGKFYADMQKLLKEELSSEEVFFFASMLHLVLVKVHPFEDGNGRAARLLEKWFLAEKLGEKAWFIESERYYYEHHKEYYNNLRRLGLEYERLDYGEAMPFLRMLSEAIIRLRPSQQ